MVIQAGSIIAGRYRVEEPLARGGMGAVFRGRHLQLDVPVAIKLMRAESADAPEAIARFEREARTAAQLKSPHIVQVFDYGVFDQTPFIAMELLEGEDLATRLDERGRLPLPQVARVLADVCKGLRRAHEEGLVHRDLKPANIFLARQGDEEVVKILDFGVVKTAGTPLAGRATATGVLVGTPRYMAPEQVRAGRVIDARTDLWALGVIAFECLTGRSPFSGDEVGDLLVSICSDPLPPPSRFLPELGRDVDAFFERALARLPDDRFQTARELASAILSLAGMPDDTTPRPGSLPSGRRAPRGPLSPLRGLNARTVKLPSPQPGAVSVATQRVVARAAAAAERGAARRSRSWAVMATAVLTVAMGAAAALLVGHPGAAPSAAAPEAPPHQAPQPGAGESLPPAAAPPGALAAAPETCAVPSGAPAAPVTPDASASGTPALPGKRAPAPQPVPQRSNAQPRTQEKAHERQRSNHDALDEM